MSGEQHEPRRSEWPLAAVIIAIVAAVTILCTVGPAPEFAGWFR